MEVLPLGGGQDIGKSCIIVTMGTKRVMLDCGMHLGYDDMRRFPDFSALAPADQLRGRAVELALPGVGELRVVGEGHREQVARGAPVLGVLPLDGRGVPLGLVADAAQSAAAQGTLTHGTPSSRACVGRDSTSGGQGSTQATGESER